MKCPNNRYITACDNFFVEYISERILDILLNKKPEWSCRDRCQIPWYVLDVKRRKRRNPRKKITTKTSRKRKTQITSCSKHCGI